MEYEFKLSEQEAQHILDVLAKEPYVEVHKLIENIQRQASEQMKEKENL